MYESQLIVEMEQSKERKENYGLAEHALRQFGSKVKELESLLAVINMSVCELSQPLTVIHGLSELLLTKVDQNDPIATDLVTISKQAHRMNKIIKGINCIGGEEPAAWIGTKY